MTRDCPTADGRLDLQNFVEHELLRTGRRCFVVVEKNEPAGLVTPHEIKQIDRAQWPFKTLHDVMRPIRDVRSVPPDASLKSALELMSRGDVNQLLIVSDGHLEGMLSRAQLLTYLQTYVELGK